MLGVAGLTLQHSTPCPPQTGTRGPGTPHHNTMPAVTPHSSLSLPEFFKFKGFGSLSSIPRSFTLRRVSVAPSSPESLGPGVPPPHGFLEEPFDGTQDDLNTMPKSPGPYARSSDMYSHMGTMPRLNLGKAGKSLGKAKSSQSCREKGIPSDKTPRTAPLPNPESPKMSGTADPGTDSPSAAGQAEQEEEVAQPVDTPGPAMARTDQEPTGNVYCPRTDTPSSSLAAKPSQTPSPDTAVGAKTTNGDLLEKGQEHPSESSPDRYGPIDFALPSAGTPILSPQGKGSGLGHSRVPAVPPTPSPAVPPTPSPTLPVGCTWPAGWHGWSTPYHGQVSGSMGARFPVGFLLLPVSGQGGNISWPCSALASFCPAGGSIPAPERATESSDLRCPGPFHLSLSSFPPPPSFSPSPSSTASLKVEGQFPKPAIPSPFPSTTSKSHSGHNPPTLGTTPPPPGTTPPPLGKFGGSALSDEGRILGGGVDLRINKRDF